MSTNGASSSNGGEKSERSATEMQYTRLGKTGMVVSRICFGCMSFGNTKWREWLLSEEDSIPFFKRALELGINFYDTAEIYSDGKSEEILGNALQKLLPSSQFRREDLVIATKIHPMRSMQEGGTKFVQKGLSRKAILDAVDASLKRLKLQYIDLYQIHRWDNNTPIEETMDALHDVVMSGRVRYIGASSMHCWQFAKAQFYAERTGKTKFVSMQNHYNLVYREEEREMLPFCIDQSVSSIPWSPLARGFLTRTKEQQNNTARAASDSFSKQMYYQDYDDKIVERVHEVAKAKTTGAAQVALAWLLQRKGVAAPIVGVTKMKHLEDAVDALNVKLTEEEVKILEQDYRPHPVLGHS